MKPLEKYVSQLTLLTQLTNKPRPRTDLQPSRKYHLQWQKQNHQPVNQFRTFYRLVFAI